MTTVATTMERAAIVPPAPAPSEPAGCPQGVPWCAGDRDWHDLDEGGSNHDSAFVIVSTDAGTCTRHDEGPQHIHEVWLAIEREDVADVAGTPQIWLSAGAVGHVCDEDAHLSLDAAEDLAAELLRLVALARGSKRAADLRLGDVVVIGGVAQTITAINHDALCCLNRQSGVHECAGSLVVETDVSGDCEPAATFELDDLVEVRAEVDR